MVLGTTSGAGKSWLATALCRYYARQGLKVAPFKAQNMSNNARVVQGEGRSDTQCATVGAEGFAAGPPQGETRPPRGAGSDTQCATVGAEIGSAQYFQALAARAEPDARMNPLLLKPEADTHSQVVLMGQVSAELTALPWRERGPRVWPQIAAALDALRAENDVVVIEGAGSPAEINLSDCDIVNLRVARHAGARCLLVTDIDRGGAFAHLFGTWALLPEADCALIHGFVLNKFRGDPALLAPGPQMLHQLTGVPTVATLPMWWQHGLPEEDGVLHTAPVPNGAPARTVAVIAWPRISNLDEFQPLCNVPGLHLKWARSPADVAGADWIILPGSKNTVQDLAWLRAQGLDRAVAAHAGAGHPVLGICGGLQMLGEALIDPQAIDGNGPGLGLLPLVTLFEAEKALSRTTARFGELAGVWGKLSGVSVSGYEIHQGQTAQHPAMARSGDVAREALQAAGGECIGWQNAAGNVLGLYLHGLFEDATVMQALFGAHVPTLDSVFDGLADFIEQHFEPGVLDALARPLPAGD
ncbi:MAG: cobyric acid synthase [Burkholderiaceae bacterium]|nr:cobyric acid synthase [Burkholderiaceae bacterium]